MSIPFIGDVPAFTAYRGDVKMSDFAVGVGTDPGKLVRNFTQGTCAVGGYSFTTPVTSDWTFQANFKTAFASDAYLLSFMTPHYGIRLNANGNLLIRLGGTAGQANWVGALTPYADKWTTLYVSVANNNPEAWINGQSIGTRSPTGWVDGGGQVILGTRDGATVEPFVGDLGHCKMSVAGSPVFEYYFDDGGNLIADYSGNNRQGSMSGIQRPILNTGLQ